MQNGMGANMSKSLINTHDLLARIDLRHFVMADLGNPSLKGSDYTQYKCPLHGEQHGHSLTIWAGSWYCFGACNRGGDAIDWVKARSNVDFTEACRLLGLPENSQAQYPKEIPVSPARSNSRLEPPPMKWQSLAAEVVSQATKHLWAPEGARALTWLREKRQLTDSTIRSAELGYIPGPPDGWQDHPWLTIPHGITIPWFADKSLWGVKVRRGVGTKYLQFGVKKAKEDEIGRANLSGALYWADHLQEGKPAFVVEGEFDCLLSWQQADDLVCPVTIGSASNSLNPMWYAALAGCTPILACTDNDPAGNNARKRLLDLGSRVIPITVPSGKDITEFVTGSNFGSLYDWLLEVNQRIEP